jgi:hypothetical protein
MLDRKYQLLKAFPKELEDDLIKVLSIINQTSKLDFSHSFEVIFYGNKLSIPERIYYNEPSVTEFNSLTKKQQIIVNCLYTRHHNGFVREENLKKIIRLCNEHNWIIPYLIRITGEYVMEILQDIKANLEMIDKGLIKDFIAKNPTFYNTTVSRVVSYWNCYYRNKYPNKEDYVGFEIIKYFNS